MGRDISVRENTAFLCCKIIANLMFRIFYARFILKKRLKNSAVKIFYEKNLGISHFFTI